MLSRRDFHRTGLGLLGALAFQQSKAILAGDSPIEPRSIPPDLPLPDSDPSHADWIRKAVVMQPWGKTQYTALTELGDRPHQLQGQFGFNSMILIPTEAHNALCDFIDQPQFHLTEEQFQTGVEAYKKAGYKLILYSSVMHCGHAQVWQSGQLGREHPDWLQRDANGDPITVFGHASWMCGSSPARDYTLNYTLEIVKKYTADGVMLDNNGFGHTINGWSCYCDYCQRGFRQYVIDRCGADWIDRELHMKPEAISIPKTPGLLFALWVDWRNRLWVEVNELFRPSLREVNPEILFFTNTQYDLPVDTQGSSLQYQHEDIVFSETHETDPWYISSKMLLGQALANGLPLWDYMGTFAEPAKTGPIDKLRPPEDMDRIIPVSLAHGACPWIVYFGFDDPESQPALREMSRYLSWFAANQRLFRGSPNGPVAALVSLRSRDQLAGEGTCNKHGVTGCQPPASTPPYLLPAHLPALLKAGVPLVALHQERISREGLTDLRIVTLECSDVMTRDEADILAKWVRAGGTLITAPDAGAYDELGRKRSSPLLLEMLKADREVTKPQKCGRGRVIVANALGFAEAALSAVRSAGIPFGLPAGVEVVCSVSSGAWTHHVLHLLRNDAGSEATSVIIPSWVGAKPGDALWYSPDWKDSKNLEIERIKHSLRIELPSLPRYSVITFGAEYITVD